MRRLIKTKQKRRLTLGSILLVLFLCSLAFSPQLVQAVITVTATVTVSHYDFDLAVTPDGKYVYVPQLDNVAVVSTATNTVMTNIDLKGAYQVAVTPNGKYAYVTGSVTGSVFPHVTTY